MCARRSICMRSVTNLPRNAKTEAGRAFGFVTIQLPDASQPVTLISFHFCVDKRKLKEAELRDGHYLLRSNLTGEDPAVLWTRYVQLTQIESVFRSLKSELGIRPVYHRLENRVDAHILVAFLAYCLQATLKHRLMEHAPGLTTTAVMEKLGAIQMIDVWVPTVDGRWLILPRYTQPEKDTHSEDLGMASAGFKALTCLKHAELRKTG